jgi:hypothetical protein
MSRSIHDRPEFLPFVGGTACLLASVALSYYLAHEAAEKLTQLEPSDFLVHDRGPTVDYEVYYTFLFGLNVLMWLVFGLGTFLTLVGLRMLRRPSLEERPLLPIGKLSEVFENPD